MKKATPVNMTKIQDWLKQHQITEVECLIPDLTGIARGKIMPTGKFCQEKGIKLPESVQISTVTGDYVADDIYDELLNPADIDIALYPDVEAMYLVPWAAEPTAAIIHDSFTKTGEMSPLSPRTVLKKVLALYKQEDLKPVVAPELEFYLTLPCLDPDIPLSAPIGRSGVKESGRQAFSIDAVNEFDPVFEEVYDHCEAMGLDIDTLIHEEGTAQMEINFCHGDPLLLADQVLFFKRTVREVALKHKMAATFMAKPISNEPGSSMHIHQSILQRKTGENLFSQKNGKPSQQFLHYLGGLQRYIPVALPLFAPNVNSYRRFLADSSAPINLEWGEDNRTAGLRVPESKPMDRRVENRLPGADCNPYLAIAASLLCGYLGMQEQIEPSEPVTGSAYDYPSKLSLAKNLEQALEDMSQDDKLGEILGTDFIKAYVHVKLAESENFKRTVSAWERKFLLLTV